MLGYGYWIREKGRSGERDVATCRIDLATGYAMTAVFGLAMVVIGSTIEVRGQGAGLVVSLADRLAGPLGESGRWAFLLGAFGAVFSSLLGVWQSAPYLFADVHRLTFARGGTSPGPVDTRGRPYRLFLVALALVPNLGLLVEFRRVQQVYAVFGALFIPMLALALLLLNRQRWLGEHRNRPLTVAVLSAAVALFLFFGGRQLAG
jgi:Natural resistance-associated macrophage protein-like